MKTERPSEHIRHPQKLCRPNFLCIFVFLLIIATIQLLAALPGPSFPVQGRCIWIDANSIPTNDQSMAAYIDSLAKANINVLFPETLRRGYTIYPSKLDTQDSRFKGYDPLSALIRDAHKHGMEVHPWVWVFRQGYSKDKGPILTTHPEWAAVSKWGETLSANGGYWVCPSIPEAREYLISIFKEIATNYCIDGIHLDYIRFENQFPAAYCYNSSCRDKFKAKSGIDPMNIQPLTEPIIEWSLWREDLVNSFVQQVKDEMHTISPAIKVSAAVGSYPDQARTSLLQNWPNWVDNKWVDFLTPMAYTADPSTFRAMVSTELAAVGEKTLVMPGIGLHMQKTPQITLDQVDIAEDMGADGITLFASAHLKEETRKALEFGPFSCPAQIPFRNPSKAVKTLLEAAENVYQCQPAEAKTYLREASRLLGYMAYQAADIGYVPPTRPPIYIPASVLPIPTVDVSKTVNPPVIDGNLDDPVWATAAKFSIQNDEMGNPSPVTTEVMISYDSNNIYIAYNSSEPTPGKIKATITKRDGPTFYDDSAEMFFDPWGKRQQYYQLAVNTLGTEFDAKLNDASVNLTWTASAKQTDKGWTAEIAVPFSSLGVNTPAQGNAWNVNFARNRWVTGKAEYLIWSVPYGSFHQPDRFGTIIFK